jgi:hypothetical protein
VAYFYDCELPQEEIEKGRKDKFFSSTKTFIILLERDGQVFDAPLPGCHFQNLIPCWPALATGQARAQPGLFSPTLDKHTQ